MTQYRIANEGTVMQDAAEESLPFRQQVPLWTADHYPTVAEMRSVLAAQPTAEELEGTHGMANIDEFAEEWGGEGQDEIPRTFWGHVYLQRQRTPRLLGWKVLGEIRPEALMVEDDSEFQLATYWRKIPHTEEYKKQRCKFAWQATGLLLGSSAVIAALEAWNNSGK